MRHPNRPRSIFYRVAYRLSVFCTVFVISVLCITCKHFCLAHTLHVPHLAEAEAAMICDSVGNVLWSKNPDTELPMASLTKIMAAVVALESNTPLDKQCVATQVDLEEDAQVAGYKPGDQAVFSDLLKVALVYSANDAITLVGREVAGSDAEFVKKMNEKARSLNLTHTQFVNCTGLESDGHYSSVRDLVTLGKYAIERFPFIRHCVSLQTVTVKVGETHETFQTTNDLLKTYPGCRGMKTGSTQAKTSFLGFAERDNITLYTCVLNCTTKEGRFTDTASLMDWAYATYTPHILFLSSAVIGYVRFADRFGWSCAINATSWVRGKIWPYGAKTTFSRVSLPLEGLYRPNDCVGVCSWLQDGRLVSTAAYAVRPYPVDTFTRSAYVRSLRQRLYLLDTPFVQE